MKKMVFISTLLLCGFGLFAASGKLEVKSGSAVVTNGWADMGKMAYAKGDVIVIDDKAYPTPDAKCKAFTNVIASGSLSSDKVTDKAAIIVLSGKVDLSGGKVTDTDHSYFDAFDPVTHQRLHKDFMYDIGSNKTIIGVNDAKVAYGGLRINANEDFQCKNIIIQNVTFWDGHGSTEYDTSIPEFSSEKASADQLVIQGKEDKATKKFYQFMPENVWIDHCTFTDGICVDLDRNYNHDGALDIKCAKNVTVSYCEFTNHDKVTLSGSSDKFTDPSEREVTFHHNYYHGCVQRMPRTRAGYFHLYNNVYDQIGTANNSGASLGPGIGAQFIVENNYFGKHKGKILKANDKSKKGSDTFYKIYSAGNNVELNASNSDGYVDHAVSEKPWKVPYSYKLDNPQKLFETIASVSGAGLAVTVNGKIF